MQFVAVQEITITKVTRKGSNRIEWNYDLDGKPFGQIWTYKDKAEVHPFQCAPLAEFGGWAGAFDTLAAADKMMRGMM